MPNAAGTGVIVRYASPYDSGAKKFTEATPAATSPYPVTMGHQCWTFGDPVNYPTSGCEHFGVSLLGNPTKTTYRWLVGHSATGTLKVAGTTGNPSIPAPVYIPAPVWNVIPQPPPAPNVPPPPPIVVAVVQAPPAPPVPPGGNGQWGDAIWMKIYKTELPEAVALEDLVLGGAVVPDPDVEAPEIEWQLLQAPPEGKVGAWEKSENEQEAAADSKSVSRRYEFYKYTGQYDPDPENFREALCDNPTELAQQTADRCGTPDASGVAGVGDLIGAQNAAVNLVVDVVDNTPPTVSFGAASPGPNAHGWNNTDVSIPFTIQDTESGVAPNNTPSPLVLSTEGGAVTGNVTATDNAGHGATVASPPVKIDKTAPTVGITVPADAGSFIVGQRVAAAYSCGDGLSGVDACAGPVASGSNIDTASVGSKTFVVNAMDRAGNTASLSVTYSVVEASSHTLSALDPAKVWVGLKNSDDVGTRFDLKAEIYAGETLIGSGQLDGLAGGSSGFNNAKQDSILLTLPTTVDVAPGSALSIRLSARIACSGKTHSSASARLWLGDGQVPSRFGATIGGVAKNYYLLQGFRLGNAPGPGPKSTRDVVLGSKAACPTRSFTPFGTWTLP